MRHPIPPILEAVAALKERLQHEPDGRQKPRLQMLYLLASGQAHTRQDGARLPGVHRNTIGQWLALYAAGGLAALLATYVPAGKPVSLAPEVLASLEQALRQWVRQTPGVEVKDKTLYTLVRTRCHTKLKVARPSHTKKILRPWRLSRRVVRSSSRGRFPSPTRGPCASPAKTKAAAAS